MDIPSASMLSSLSQLREAKEYPEPPPADNFFVSHPKEFQKFLTGALFKTGSVDQAKATGIPPLRENVRSPGSILPADQPPSRPWAEQFRIYKEAQLLVHPGGDFLNLKASEPRTEPKNHHSFWERVGNDIKDAFSNAGNFVKDVLWGSEYRYIDADGQVQSAQKKGLLRNVVSFFKNAVSGLSFGQLRTNDDLEPHGIVERVKFAGEKLISKAFLDDLIFGVPSSAINLFDDTALTVWNLMEVVPDATIGNIPEGQRVVTTLFDNGQVLIDYITDCLPTGDAWMRIHACQIGGESFTPPVLFNLQLPEQYAKDSRWNTVRNTPFRKTIETIGSLLADIGLATATHYAVRTSKGGD